MSGDPISGGMTPLCPPAPALSVAKPTFMPTAAPARFPYVEHRAMAEVMADETAIGAQVWQTICSLAPEQREHLLMLKPNGRAGCRRGHGGRAARVFRSMPSLLRREWDRTSQHWRNYPTPLGAAVIARLKAGAA